MTNEEVQVESSSELTVDQESIEEGDYVISVQAIDNGVPAEYSNKLEATYRLANPAIAVVSVGGSLTLMSLFLILTTGFYRRHLK